MVPIQRSTRSELAHNGKVRLQPQHSTEVSRNSTTLTTRRSRPVFALNFGVIATNALRLSRGGRAGPAQHMESGAAAGSNHC